MGKVYTVCGDDVKALVGKLTKKYYGDMIEAGVSVECVFADAGEDKDGKAKPAVKLHGVPKSAVIKKNSVAQRTEGLSDATITIDEHVWENLSDPERLALIDHELYHIDVQREEDGAVKTDEAGRPIIKLKPHDWELSGFRSIAERHQDAALEVQAMIEFQQSDDGQLVFSFKNRG